MRLDSVIPSEKFVKYTTLRLAHVVDLGRETHADYRLQLRAVLKQMMNDRRIETDPSWMKLNERPSHAKYSINLSHSARSSFIGIVELPLQIGVDIEDTNRINPKALVRVCTRDELAAAPNPLLVWSAKEAAFKSGLHSVKVISSVEIFDWQATTKNSWMFKARETQGKTELPGIGEIRLIAKQSAAFFISNL